MIRSGSSVPCVLFSDTNKHLHLQTHLQTTNETVSALYNSSPARLGILRCMSSAVYFYAHLAPPPPPPTPPKITTLALQLRDDLSLSISPLADIRLSLSCARRGRP